MVLLASFLFCLAIAYAFYALSRRLPSDPAGRWQVVPGEYADAGLDAFRDPLESSCLSLRPKPCPIYVATALCGACHRSILAQDILVPRSEDCDLGIRFPPLALVPKLIEEALQRRLGGFGGTDEKSVKNVRPPMPKSDEASQTPPNG